MTEPTNRFKAILKIGLLAVVLIFGYALLRMGTLKIIWGDQMTWKEVLISGVLLGVVVLLIVFYFVRNDADKNT